MTATTALSEIRGLPAHVLLVHAVVVLVPLTAALLVLAAWWRPARVRLGPFLPLLAAGCLVLVPVTTNAGEWLQRHVNPDPLVQRHAELGDQLLPWVAGLLLLSLAVWHLGRRRDVAPRSAVDPIPAEPAERLVPVGAATGRGRSAASGGAVRVPAAGSRVGAPARPGLSLAVAVLATLVAAGSIVQVVRIGESGSKAVWSGVVHNGT